MGERVVVAMSGGVDSSVAAALLREWGYEVIGVGLRLPEQSGVAGSRATCCGMAGMEDARAVAARIDIPFYILDYRRAFARRVIAPFCEAYAKGETPNPCILCNARIKFGLLMDMALALGADYVATGHYACVEHRRGDNRPTLCKGLDPEHDQSYFLYSLTLRQLAHTLFPLGSLDKAEVREIARELGLPVADKPSSQDICFVGPGGYREFLAKECPQALRPGPIVDSTRRVLGRHGGIAAYTVGQRRGLGIAAAEPLYVTALDTTTNTIVVGTKDETYLRALAVDSLNWLACDPPGVPLQLSVKTRYRGVEVAAEVFPSNGQMWVRFSEPRPMVAPGQAAVFYSGDVLVGGGVVRSYAPYHDIMALDVHRQGGRRLWQEQ